MCGDAYEALHSPSRCFLEKDVNLSLLGFYVLGFICMWLWGRLGFESCTISAFVILDHFVSHILDLCSDSRRQMLGEWGRLAFIVMWFERIWYDVLLIFYPPPAICVSSRCLDVDDHKCPVLKCFWILRALPTAGSPWFKFPKAYKRGNIPPIYSFRIFFFFLLRSENLSSYSLSSWDFFPYFLIPFSYFTDVSRIFAETCWLLIAIQLSSLFCLISFLILWRNGDKCYPSKPKKL